MNSLSLAAWCGLAMAATAAFAQAQPSALGPADSNHDAKVSRKEYQASRHAFIMRADLDHDGQVSRAEWDRYAKSVRHDLELDGVRGAERIGQGAWWDALDADKNGFVTYAEIYAMTAGKFADYDADHDGFISRSEAQQVLKRAQAELR
ncbi:MAG: hypothetical protein ACJ798_10545 [Phenylobacterium sp.]